MKKRTFIKTGHVPGVLLGTALFVAALLPAGCGNDNETDGGGTATGGRTALQVTGGISVQPQASPQTRAHDAAWDTGDRIGIYMFAAGTTDIAEKAENIPYTTTADATGSFTPTATAIYYPVDGSNVDFHAWYPYTDVSEAEQNQWTADLTGQSSQAALDLMTADAKSETGEGGIAYNKDNPAVALNFRHRLTKLVLAINPGAGISADDLKGLEVEITGQPATATYDPQLDAIGTTETSVPVTLLTAADGTSAEAILFPNDVAENAPQTGRQLVFTLDNAKQEVFRWNIPDAKYFKAGEKNLYTITMNRTALDVTSTVTDWTPGNGSTGEEGSAE